MPVASKLGWKRAALAFALAAALLAGCTNANDAAGNETDAGAGTDGSGNGNSQTSSDQTPVPASYEVDEQPSRVFYEIFVRSFYDTNGDGIGDLNGVTEKLDYLDELGVGGIWLMPINASPSYHGYDVTDYYTVNPEYGTLEDLKRLLDEAHKRDIEVIMDLVVNHTSSEHPWFKDALANPDSPYRSWYTIAGKDEQLQADGAVGGNPWHPYGSLKYLGVFWSGMPDLNFEEPKVREEMIKIGRYWLDQGLDGFRLDAAKHIYGDFASTVNKPEVQADNLAWWQEFRAGLAAAKQDVYLIGEVWDSVSVIAPYFDKALDSAFHFDLAGKLISAAQTERDPDLAYSLGRVYGAYEAKSGGAFLDAPFLSNHDQNRVMSMLGGNLDHARMAASLLLTLPGTPFLYYGEEIGMTGMKPDEYIREPMLWHASAEGGEGQTSWIAPRFALPGSGVSVESQLNDESSLLAHYKTLIGWRNEEPALRDGGIGEYKMAEAIAGVSAYVRMTKSERALVVHNLTGETRTAELTASDTFGEFKEIVRSTNDGAKLEGATLSLPPYSTVILK
ncbi:alpha-amylase family glycosyl hydrolase [Paenibacillus sp. LHD-117]|uniref:alpha-amylase family glycosyl hydrolase n=1 Tax=Paenibacillus sp. LHD-117 TaxID=3071412 RepID=UPI0027E04F41|nr:alpha-amylase family glycosyl hydrolase [Paenibacillus sp. LHD-117]MDQ6423156.1 alpha-amylase family glycosyl hydrolase [Paenibacillus sp. LHD-117]